VGGAQVVGAQKYASNKFMEKTMQADETTIR